MSTRRSAPQRIVRLELALQGGGAHGAFTWGVRNRLLDEPRLCIVAIGGASAGAINAVLASACLPHHWRTLGRDSTFCCDERERVKG